MCYWELTIERIWNSTKNCNCFGTRKLMDFLKFSSFSLFRSKVVKPNDGTWNFVQITMDVILLHLEAKKKKKKWFLSSNLQFPNKIMFLLKNELYVTYFWIFVPPTNFNLFRSILINDLLLSTRLTPRLHEMVPFW